MIKLSKQKLLVWFLAFTLLGIQVVQSSPIHNHIQHQVGCVLCHFDSHDQGLVVQVFEKPFDVNIVLFNVFSEPDYFSFHYLSYQSRSPPTTYS
jgi:hypothetical protein